MSEINNEQLASLMEENMGLVVLLANAFKPKDQSELEEFLQLGRIGLWKAIKKHDPKRAKLSTLIWHCVRWEILRHLDKEKNRKGFLPINDSICGDIDNHSDFWELIPDTLDEKESKVIQLRLEGNTFMDIGKELGYSRGWANNIFKTAINKIKESNGKEKKNINV
jgi:DNA-directed RNA polymerase specialized sigma subunit